MLLKDLDLALITNLISQQLDHVTCLHCCKYYVDPETAACGHTLCQACWLGRRTCPVCASQLERKHLKQNRPLQDLTEHVTMLGESFENLFKIKLDEFNLDTTEIESEKDPIKNVKDWLTSSQNHFSAPVHTESQSQDSVKSDQPPNSFKVSAKNIIIHSDIKKTVSSKDVVHVKVAQDNWDKIEPMPEPESNVKISENILGPMDIEPFYVENTEYSMDHPRRSSRRKENKNEEDIQKHELSEKHACKEITNENDKQLPKNKNTWNNVKKMRKEFSKLNKKNRNKLNVSIEMVKKTQNVEPATINTSLITKSVHNIVENTPMKEIDADSNNLIDDSQVPNRNNKGNANNIALTNNLHKPVDELDTIVENYNNESNHGNLETSSKISEANKTSFVKKGALDPRNIEGNKQSIDKSQHKIQAAVPSSNSDDIEISIKIGSVITNIIIKKKTNDVQVKVNTDREVQTSIGAHSLLKTKNDFGNNVEMSVGDNGNIQKQVEIIKNVNSQVESNLQRSDKKNTASADTATAQFEITESVEKELSKEMEMDVISTKTGRQEVGHNKQVEMDTDDRHENIDDLNDIDIFNSGSIKEANVKLLKETAPSEILIPTVHNKAKTQKNPDKRERENDDQLLPKNKKAKNNNLHENPENNNQLTDSEPINYDSFMGHVFATIDADIDNIKKTQEIKNSQDINLSNNEKINKDLSEVASQLFKTQTISRNTSQKVTKNSKLMNEVNEYNQKHSENVFTILEKEDEHSELRNTSNVPQQVEELLTPGLCRDLNESQDIMNGIKRTTQPTHRTQDDDDDDKSVVEETPQKNISVGKLKRVSTSNDSQLSINVTKKVATRKPELKSIISLTDSMTEPDKINKNETIIDAGSKKISIETPLTITKFTNHITHNSTPVARKSLNFDNSMDDPEQTLCPTTEIEKTTQEREFMKKVFEKSPTASARKQLSRNIGIKNTKTFCLAGSCLKSTEILKLKILCNERKWKYVEKYTPDLTHLVVGVDEEKRSQRSVKYMCALAASKWIVSFEWIEKCLETKDIVDEEYFEAVDSTGEPGPRRSRLAKHKLFHGIMFYCMPPFSMLDVDTLKSMVVSAGGRVAASARDVRAAERAPALLLAEPEHTQEDRFIFLAMEESVVPVNYEWVLNCLGSYTLGSVHELLLCPSSLLPPATAKWPEVLIAQED